MSSIKITGQLGSAVAAAGTFTMTLPARIGPEYGSFNAGDIRSGVLHSLVIAGTAYTWPKDFSFSVSGQTVTVTNKTSSSWPSGSNWISTLDIPGTPIYRTSQDFTTGTREVRRAAKATLALLTLGAPIASDDDGIMVSSSPGAGALTFGGALVSGGQAVFDSPRNVIITSGGNDSGITFTITGKDEYGNTMIETITGANTGIAAGKKAFAVVTTTPTKSGSAAGTVKIGTGDVLGLPVFLPGTAAAFILKELQDGAVATAGTAVAGVTTSGGSTATTGDVRGTYDPNAACDGAKVFELLVALPNPQFLGMAQYAG